MEVKKGKADILFYLSWILICGYNLFVDKSEIRYLISSEIFEKIIYMIVIFVLVYKIFIYDSKIKTKTFLILISVFMVVLVVSLKSVGINLLMQLIFIIAARNIDFKKFVKVDLFLRILCTFLLFILSITGVITNYSGVFYSGSKIKYAFGWIHPNMFGAIIITIFLEIIYLKWNKKTHIMEYLIFIIGIILLEKYSLSRTQIYSFLFILLLVILIRIWPKIVNCKLFKIISVLISPICAVISYVIVRLYESGTNIGLQINSALTGRVYFSSYFLNTYGISIFGEKVNLISSRIAKITGEKSYILDMSYIKLGIVYGVIFLLIFLAMHVVMQHKLIKKKMIPEVLMVMYFAVVGIASNSLLSIFTNPTIFMIWLIANKKENEEDKLERI